MMTRLVLKGSVLNRTYIVVRVTENIIHCCSLLLFLLSFRKKDRSFS